MKKHLIIAGIICAASIPPVYAVTKCVKLSPSTTCTTTSGFVNGQSNWSATCGGIEIQGVAFCGAQDGGSIGTKSETVEGAYDNNTYCWCKMVSPAVSSWVFSYSSPYAYQCADFCVYDCMRALSNYAFRSALFSGLSD